MREGRLGSALLPIVLAACAASDPHLYSGERLPSERLATIGSGSDSEVTKIDGRSLSGRTWYVLPGEHTAQVESERSAPAGGHRFRTRMTCLVTFDAVEGETYIATSKGSLSGSDGFYAGSTLKVWLERASRPGSEVGKTECEPTPAIR